MITKRLSNRPHLCGALDKAYKRSLTWVRTVREFRRNHPFDERTQDEAREEDDLVNSLLQCKAELVLLCVLIILSERQKLSLQPRGRMGKMSGRLSADTTIYDSGKAGLCFAPDLCLVLLALHSTTNATTCVGLPPGYVRYSRRCGRRRMEISS